MSPRTAVHTVAIAVAALPAGCGDEQTIAPPSVRYGVDSCNECLMIISDARYAASAVVEVDGRLEPARFDDIGCLLAFERDAGDAIRAVYVRAFDEERWLELDEAVYLHSGELRSPMAFGVAAFATKGAAEAERDRHPGDVLDGAPLRERSAQGRLHISPNDGR